MHQIKMKRPASWAGELWREALPVGNGLTSALLTGTVGYEHFLVSRFDRWEESIDPEIPDVSYTLEETRKLLKAGDYGKANSCLSDALKEKGYQTAISKPCAPVEIRMRFEAECAYKHYSRGIDIDTGEAFVKYEQNGAWYERRAFISRADDQAVFLASGEKAMRLKIDKPQDTRLHMRVLLPMGGSMEDFGEYIDISDAKEVFVFAKFDRAPEEASYEALLNKHLPLYKEAMGDADLSVADENRATEELLDITHEDEAPNELYEKMWRFGRYLFASGTAEGGNPFPLYGLWAGRANLPWAQNVANENVEMIYWHAPAGGYAYLLRPLIHYYFGKMDVFKDAAKKLFGCRGIYVSTYTSPKNSVPSPNVPVIVNYIGCAGWLCRHFYDYYRYTGDEELLKKEILPFMLEAARFYEDYAVRDENGRIMMIPSVSPENTPKNFIPRDFQTHMGHMNPVVWNSTMDFAIVKELLTNLLILSGHVEMDVERVQMWKKMLSDMPGYMVNEDGAIREWMDEKLEDFYMHRHLSHLYPLFPGEEISGEDALFPAFEKAVDLRELGGLSGWALAHMSAIYARLFRGDKALDCLNTLAKGCLLPNLFTLHNDWRDMGVSLLIDIAPVQLDALLGAVNAMQEMLLYAAPDQLVILPACPDRLNKGEVRNWHFPGGRISFCWDREAGKLDISLCANRRVDVRIAMPAWAGKTGRAVHLEAGEQVKL